MRRRATLAAIASGAIPAPPVINTVYGDVPANLNGDGAPVGAYADPTTNTVYLPRDFSPYMRAHETGHLFDSQILTDGDRHYFTRILRAPGGPWNRAHALGETQGEISPNEWFADYYAGAVTGLHPGNGYNATQFADVDAKRMRQFEKAMKRLMKRRGLKPYQP